MNMEEAPRCSKCKKKMFRKKDRDTGIIYWDCGSEDGKCIFRVPIWEKKLNKNERKFLNQLK